MDIVWLYALGSVAVVSIVSLIGILTLSMKESRLRSILIYLVSFSAGALALRSNYPCLFLAAF
jgi:hypothetical protein